MTPFLPAPPRSREAAHLAVTGVSRSFAGRRVLSDVSFTARTGDRVGLIGENGTGKSTLLRILGGLDRPDSGTVSHAASHGSLAQEPPYPADAPVGRVLDDAQREAIAARKAVEQAGAALAQDPDGPGAADAYAEALEAADRLGAWETEVRRGEALAGLGLSGIPATTPVGELSGGQRLRLSLAALLLEAPHTLLLDEPSNHLDDSGVAYLERTLTAWPGIVLFASHDRALLDAVATRILDLDAAAVPAAVLADAAQPGLGIARPDAPRAEADTGSDTDTGAETTDDTGSGLGVRIWGMGYSATREAQRAELARWRERYAAEQEERGRLIHEIEVGAHEVNRKHESKSESRITRKFYADKDARVTARRARSARVRLEQLERERVRRPPEPLRFAGIGAPEPGEPAASAGPPDEGGRTARRAEPEPILRATDLECEGRLSPMSLAIEARARLLLTGPNGAGKSTLLEILADRLHPDAGELEVRPGARIGHLPQEVDFERPDRSAAETYAALVGADLAECRPLESSGLLAPRDVSQPVGALSVGQRRRLALAALLADPPHLLLLDEPTNHLSLTLVEELEAALNAFDGAVVLASHDRHLRAQWAGETLSLVPV